MIHRFLTLNSGQLRLQLLPELGGSIARFDLVHGEGVHPIMRGAAGTPESPIECASFPLVPFVNRIRGGRFEFRGRTVALASNLAGEKSPLHGQGWLSPWAVESHGGSDATLVFRHDAGEWPWSYEARQNFALDDSGLSVTLACTNLSPGPMPCGLGQHPYWPCVAETIIDTRVDHVWTIDENVLPVERVPAVGRYALDGKPICGRGLDNGYGGWGGVARIATPGALFEVRLSSPDVRFFQLYSPPGGGFFVAEPVSHANAAMNEPEERWPERGLRVLGPGESMSLAMRVDVLGT